MYKNGELEPGNNWYNQINEEMGRANINYKYMITPFFEGVDLETLIRQRHYKFELNELVTFVNEMFTTLKCLHSKNIVHRDIKPSNIMYNGEDFTLIDYGLSCYEACVRPSGTPLFVPLFIMYNIYNNIKPSFEMYKVADFFAIGVTLYEMANNGRHPFEENLNYQPGVNYAYGDVYIPSRSGYLKIDLLCEILCTQVLRMDQYDALYIDFMNSFIQFNQTNQ